MKCAPHACMKGVNFMNTCIGEANNSDNTKYFELLCQAVILILETEVRFYGYQFIYTEEP